LGANRDHGLHTGSIWKIHFHERDIRLVLLVALQGFGPGSGLSDQQHVCLVPDDRGDPVAKEWVIIYTQDADLARFHY
jgi:hypothetical protein